MPMERERNLSTIAAVAAVLVLIVPPCVYVVGYFATVEHSVGISIGGSTSWSPGYRAFESSQMGAGIVFHPIHWLDRNWIRPGYWVEDYYETEIICTFEPLSPASDSDDSFAEGD
jgi:hypothetical protein